VDFYSRRFQAVEPHQSELGPAWRRRLAAKASQWTGCPRWVRRCRPAVKAQADGKMHGDREMMVTQELGDPFRRDALSKPVRYLTKSRRIPRGRPLGVTGV